MKLFKFLLVLLLSCGALQAYASEGGEAPAEGGEAPAEGEAAAAKPGFLYHLLDPDIITNYLSDGKTLGYVRVTVELMAENEADLKLLEQHDPLIRDAIIRLMGSKSADQIKSLVSREDLRKECQTRANELLVKETGKKAVRELIFTKFLYQ